MSNEKWSRGKIFGVLAVILFSLMLLTALFQVIFENFPSIISFFNIGIPYQKMFSRFGSFYGLLGFFIFVFSYFSIYNFMKPNDLEGKLIFSFILFYGLSVYLFALSW